MSVFGVGGTLGIALGPSIATAALLLWGLKGTLVLAVPAALTAGLLLWRFSDNSLRGGGLAPSRATVIGKDPDAWGPFARLTATVVARAILGYGLNTFIPLYWIYGLQQSKAAGALALTVFSLTGVFGNLLGGHVADRLGHARVATVGFCALIPLVPALAAVRGDAVALVLVAAIGFVLAITYSPLVVLGQQYLPNHIGLSSGVTLGISVTVGGVATPLLGQVADHYGVWAAIAALALSPPLAAALGLTLPHPAHLTSRSPSCTADTRIRG
jgi:FSR family fosmidomycin resistance protein-like MFS transporter